MNDMLSNSLQMPMKSLNCIDCINYHDCPAMKGKKCEGVPKQIETQLGMKAETTSEASIIMENVIASTGSDIA